MDYLFYYTGECSDALQERYFYIIPAQNLKVAYALLQVGLIAEGSSDSAEYYSVFLTGDNLQAAELGYNVRACTRFTHDEISNELHTIFDIWSGDQRSLPLNIIHHPAGDEPRMYFGNDEYGIEVGLYKTGPMPQLGYIHIGG